MGYAAFMGNMLKTEAADVKKTIFQLLRKAREHVPQGDEYRKKRKMLLINDGRGIIIVALCKHEEEKRLKKRSFSSTG